MNIICYLFHLFLYFNLLWFAQLSIAQDKPWHNSIEESLATQQLLYWMKKSEQEAPYEDFITDYLEQLKKKLLAPTDPLLQVPIFVINSPSVNAFALSGTGVVITTGLIASTERESQLAYVLAHELGHLHHRHFVESQQQNQIINLQMAGIVLLSALFKSGELLPPAIISAQAYGQQKILQFSRQHEMQADEFAHQKLSAASFSVQEGLSVMHILGQLDSSSAYHAIPDFLRSHPHPQKRYSHFYPTPNKNKEDAKNSDDEAYRIIRQHSRYALRLDHPKASCCSHKNTISDYSNALHTLHYGSKKSFAKCSQKLDSYEKNIYTTLLKSEFSAKESPSEQVELLEKLYQQDNTNLLVLKYYIQALINIQEYDLAKKALLNTPSINATDGHQVIYLKAQLADYEENWFEKHYFMGQYYSMIQEWQNSHFHLQKAKNIESLSAYQKWLLQSLHNQVVTQCQAYYWLFPSLEEDDSLSCKKIK